MDIVEEITNIEEEEDVNPFIEEEEIQEEIQEEIPTIDSYFTLVRDSNTLVINKFKELYNFLEQDPTSEEDLENQELIKKN
jgi:hypothetical protein